MKVPVLVMFSILVNLTSFSQETFDLTDNLPDKQDAYTVVAELEMFIKLADGYEKEIHEGFDCYVNKETNSRIQFMKLEMEKDYALDEVMGYIDESRDSKVIHEDYVNLDGYESFLFTVLNSSGEEDRIEFYLVTPYMEGSLVFKGSAPNKEAILAEIKEMIVSLKRGL